MELKIESQTNDVYFDRDIIDFKIKLESGEMAKIEDVKKELESQGINGTVLIYTIKSLYGKNEAKGIAHLYKDEKTAMKVLPKYILKKNGIENGKEETKKQ